ncbi:MAG: DUF4199 domain-containing protein [Flavobacteriales bacterium]|nr:DUF4199 domain-containing protein [Flavobacteriales bacterium]
MKPSIRLGLIAGLLSGIALLIEFTYFFDKEKVGVYAMMFKMLMMIVCTYAAIFITAKQLYNSNIPFNIGVKEGIIVAAIIGISMGVANIVYVKYLDPLYLDTLAAQGRATLLEQGMNEEEITGSIDRFYSFNTPWVTLIKEIAFNLFLGVICSIIITFMIRRVPIRD